MHQRIIITVWTNLRKD